MRNNACIGSVFISIVISFDSVKNDLKFNWKWQLKVSHQIDAIFPKCAKIHPINQWNNDRILVISLNHRVVIMDNFIYHLHCMQLKWLLNVRFENGIFHLTRLLTADKIDWKCLDSWIIIIHIKTILENLVKTSQQMGKFCKLHLRCIHACFAFSSIPYLS